jgi:hypothetical protein
MGARGTGTDGTRASRGQTVPTSEAFVSLDVSDPLHPALVQTLELGPDYRQHWIAADADGNRIVATGRGATGPATPHGALFLR